MTAYQVTVYDLKAFAENIAPHLVAKAMPKRNFSGEETRDTINRAQSLAKDAKEGICYADLGYLWSGKLQAEYGLTEAAFIFKKFDSIQ